LSIFDGIGHGLVTAGLYYNTGMLFIHMKICADVGECGNVE